MIKKQLGLLAGSVMLAVYSKCSDHARFRHYCSV